MSKILIYSMKSWGYKKVSKSSVASQYSKIQCRRLYCNKHVTVILTYCPVALNKINKRYEKNYKRSTKPIFSLQNTQICLQNYVSALSRGQIDKYVVEWFARLENKLTIWRQIEGWLFLVISQSSSKSSFTLLYLRYSQTHRLIT